MELILLTKVQNLGNLGDKVRVAVKAVNVLLLKD